MNCPYCQAELVYHDSYGKSVPGEHYWIPSHFQKIGEIFKCPNFEGFESKEEAISSLRLQACLTEEQIKKIEDDDSDTWEYIICGSNAFHGFFYTDQYDNLYEGYPC